MVLSAKQMQSIADEIGETINRNVNIMNEEGYIIASTDASRIGMLHKGAKKIIEEKLDVEIISREDSDLETRAGVNYPLMVNGQLAGVVGITGDYEEIGTLGKVIRKMTEILIMDRYRNSQKRIRENLRKNMAIEWLFGKDEESLKSSASILGIDVQLKRRIVVMEMLLPSEEKEGMEFQEQHEEMDRLLRQKFEDDSQQLVLSMGNREILFLKEDHASLYEVKKYIPQLEKIFFCKIYTGIGIAGEGKEGLIRSYKTAEAACILAKQLKEERMIAYDDSDLRFLLGSIPGEKRKNYLEKIWGNAIRYEEREEIVRCLRSYIRNEGSLTKTAEELYIHKNTLQYRLAKIKNITGYDPRKVNEVIYLNIAVFLEELTD